MTEVILKKGKEKKILNFYPFIYKDEVEKIDGEFLNGDIVKVYDINNNFIAQGYINNNSHVLVRILSLSEEQINYHFIEKKIISAYKKRLNLLNETNSFRLFYSEADGLPGLIVDYFDKYLVVQFRTIGIEKFKEMILKVLIENIMPKGIYERSDVDIRDEEGAEQISEVIYGEIPKEIIMIDNGIKFLIDIINGQKTGFFLDQRDSRKFIKPFCNEEIKFLDVFSSSGGFSMAAMSYGVKNVTAIDKSMEALNKAHENYKLNNFNAEFKTIEADAFYFMKVLIDRNEKYDFIVLDPPALIKKKSDIIKGRDYFFYLCDSSFKLLSEKGILGVCTCAYHLSINDLMEVTRIAASKNNKKLEVLGITYQPSDHPWILHIPETLYLKCLWVKIID